MTFRALGREEIEKIVDIQLRDLQKRLAERKITIEPHRGGAQDCWPSGATTRSSARGRSSARIQRMVENPLAVEVLAGRFHEGDHMVVEARRDRETFTFRKEAPVEQPA